MPPHATARKAAMTKARIPYCTTCLVISAIACHSMVLVGNLRIADAVDHVGDSAKGWSVVGFQLSDAINLDVDDVLENVTVGLTNSTKFVLDLQKEMDSFLAALGNLTDNAVAATSLVETVRQRREEKEVEAGSANMLQTSAQVLKGGDLQADSGSNGASISSGGFEHVTIDGSGSFSIESEDAYKVNAQSAVAVQSSAPPTRRAARPGSCRLVQLPSMPSPITEEELADYIEDALVDIKKLIDKLIDFLWPVLEQVGNWTVSFGDRVQGVLESFSTSLDSIQKLVDTIVELLDGGDDDTKDLMIHDTYTIMDADTSGNISVIDLMNVSMFYGVDALQGRSAKKLMKKYDTNGDGELDRKEYNDFVDDEALPDVMAVTLREYARRLSQISGTVERAKLRDEVGSAVVDYFSLVCAKNATKVGWVSDRLTNGSLPLEFTADVLKQLAENRGNPNIRTTADVGLVVISRMMELDEDYTLKAFTLMKNEKWWHNEGFDPETQPSVIKKVTRWMTTIQERSEIKEEDARVGDLLLEHLEEWVSDHQRQSPKLLQLEGIALHDRVEMVMAEKVRVLLKAKVVERAKRRKQLMHYRTSRLLFHHLTQGPQSTSSDANPALERAVKSGQPAAPETLLFAKYLAANASSTADRFQKQASDYLASSSNPLQSFSNDVKGMINKIVSFIESMERYASPKGRQNFREKIDNFLNNATDEIMGVLRNEFGTGATDVDRAIDQGTVEVIVNVNETVSKVWSELSSFFEIYLSIMPTVVENVIFAREQVGGVTRSMTSIFDTLDKKTAPLFPDLADLYRTVWIIYFFFFTLLTLGILFYGFWAAGFCGGPGKDEGYEPPRTFMARIGACLDCCSQCLSACQDGHLTCWSLIIFAEIIVLILFLVAIVLSIIAGVQAFITSGCAMVYLLGDNTVCGGVLDKLTVFLVSFVIGNVDGAQACDKEKLTTCGNLIDDFGGATLFIILGSLLASVVTLELVVEAAVTHEQAYWRRHLLKDTAYDEEYDDEEKEEPVVEEEDYEEEPPDPNRPERCQFL